MKKKFSHFKNLSKIYRVRGIEKTRHNSIRLDFNERVSPFSNSFIKSISKKNKLVKFKRLSRGREIIQFISKEAKAKKRKYFTYSRFRYWYETLLRSFC